MADQGKRCDHKVAVALTNFIGSCFGKFFGKIPHSRGLSTDVGPGLLLRRGGGQGKSWGGGLERGLLYVGTVAQQPGRQSLGQRAQKGSQGWSFHGPGVI